MISINLNFVLKFVVYVPFTLKLDFKTRGGRLHINFYLIPAMPVDLVFAMLIIIWSPEKNVHEGESRGSESLVLHVLGGKL